MTGGKVRDYLLISPCRDEAAHMRRTLDSVVAQTLRPSLWIVVDDGSTDATPDILAEYVQRHDWIRVVRKLDRGQRAVGPGVIEAFYHGLETVDLEAFQYLCKLDLDLDLPERYFETLIERMEENPRLGTCSGRSCYRNAQGRLVSEGHGSEMSEGMTKFYRRACFQQIGGFVRAVMWDGIDCHMARKAGWVVRSYDDLKFEHLRPMGSSQTSVYTGRRRHGAGQYYMGSDPIYFIATAIRKMARPPYILGGLATLQGYMKAWLDDAPRHEDSDLRRFIRRYQRRALVTGKARTVARIEGERAEVWSEKADRLS